MVTFSRLPSLLLNVSSHPIPSHLPHPPSIVAHILDESELNCAWLPDAIESELYLNCLCLILTVLHDCLHTVQFKTMGQSYRLEAVSTVVGSARSSLPAL